MIILDFYLSNMIKKRRMCAFAGINFDALFCWSSQFTLAMITVKTYLQPCVMAQICAIRVYRDGGRQEGAQMHKNNGTLVRLVASILVLTQHAWMLTGRADPAGSTGYLPWIGQIGVLMFFSLSGYLLANRIVVENLQKFIVNRIFRIYPLLLAVNLLSVIIGLFITSKTFSEYFNEGAAGIVFSNIIFFGQQNLPGVRLGADYVGSFGFIINIAQWSLFYEIRAYAILCILFLAGIFNDRRILNMAIILVVIMQPTQTWLHFGDPRAFDITLAFLFGCGIAANNIRVDLVFTVKIVSIALVSVLLNLSYYGVILNLCIAVVTIYFAFGSAPYIKIADTKFDLSYGLFLLHWPIMLALTSIIPKSPWLLLSTATVITIFVAYPFNLFVEEPARSLGRKLGGYLWSDSGKKRSPPANEIGPSIPSNSPKSAEVSTEVASLRSSR